MHLEAVNQVAVFEVIPRTSIISQKSILDGMIHMCILLDETKLGVKKLDEVIWHCPKF